MPQVRSGRRRDASNALRTATNALLLLAALSAILTLSWKAARVWPSTPVLTLLPSKMFRILLALNVLRIVCFVILFPKNVCFVKKVFFWKITCVKIVWKIV